jgi:hypothetical protein
MNNLPKILVIGNVGNESHENSVRNYALQQLPTAQVDIAEIGSGTPSGNIVTYQASVAACVSYAITNGYDAIVRSYTGLWANKLEWDTAWVAGILVVHAHGGNAHTLLTTPPDIWGAAVACGAGNGSNQCSYGNGLEFYDSPAEVQTPPFAESWSTPIVACKLLQIAIATNCTFREARYIYARSTASNPSWNQNDGFGIIDVDAAIAYTPVARRERIIRGRDAA